MQLTTIQYDAIMMSIDTAKSAIVEDTFIDPYGDNPNGYTNETLLQALEQVENMIISDNVPLL
jgi:hypothetical protein